MQETEVPSLGWENPLEKEMATHSIILAWKNYMDRGAWQATVHRVTKELNTTEQLSKHAYTNVSIVISGCALNAAIKRENINEI